MLHLITAARISEFRETGVEVALRSLERKECSQLLSLPQGYALLEGGRWRVWVGWKGKQIFSANVPDYEADIVRAVRYMPQAVILIQRDSAERFLPILERNRVEARVYHTETVL